MGTIPSESNALNSCNTADSKNEQFLYDHSDRRQSYGSQSNTLTNRMQVFSSKSQTVLSPTTPSDNCLQTPSTIENQKEEVSLMSNDRAILEDINEQSMHLKATSSP